MNSEDATVVAVSSFFAKRRRRSKGDLLYQLYVVGLLCSLSLYILIDAHGQTRPSDPTEFLSWTRGALSAAALVFLLAGARFAVWGGPVLVSGPDAAWLLPAPLPRAALLRPRLATGLALGAAAGGMMGFGIVFVLATNTESALGGLLLATFISWSFLGLLAAALGALIEASRRLARAVMVASLPLAVAAGGLIPGGHKWPGLAIWSGPWAWATALVLAGAGASPHGWLAAGVLLLSATAVATLVALLILDRIHDEELVRRAGVSSGVLASLFLFDWRTLALIRARGTQDLGGRRTVRLPPPPWPAFAIVWRDAVSLARSPSRLGWSGLFVTAGVGLAAGFPWNGAVRSVAVLVSYFGAAQLLEPMRIEIEAPQAYLLLDKPLARVGLAHTLLPTLIVALLAAVACIGWTIVGVIPPRALVPSFATSAVVAPLLVVCAAASALRADPPLDLLRWGDLGLAALAIWLSLGPLLALGILGFITWVASAALSRGTALDVVGPFFAMLAVTITLIGLGMLYDGLSRLAELE